MLTLSYDKVDAFVEKQSKLGNDVSWDGWDLVFFNPSKRGVYMTNRRNQNFPEIVTGGAFRNGRWGFLTRVAVNDQGNWRVPGRNVRRPKRSRS